MKTRILRLISILLALMVPLWGAASGQADVWYASCTWATAQETRLYTATYVGDGVSVAYTFQEAGMLPAGQRVELKAAYADMQQVTFWLGGARTAWVKAADLTPLSSATALPPATEVPATPTPTMKPTATPTATPTPEPTATPEPLFSGAWAGFEVTQAGEPVCIEALGSAWCRVQTAEGRIEVPTGELIWGTGAQEDKRLAVIDAPRTGQARLRAKAASNAKVLMQCSAGQLVAVTEPGKKFTRVVCEGVEGYVLTSALNFLPVTQAEKGVLAASTTMYAQASTKQPVSSLPAGTEVAVLTQDGVWCCIEVDGLRGYVKTACFE